MWAFIDKTYADRLAETLVIDLAAFAPELLLCLGIVLVMILRMFRGLARIHYGIVGLVVLALAMALAWTQWQGDFAAPQLYAGGLFSGLIAYDYYTLFFRLLIPLASILVLALVLVTGVPPREDSADFVLLLLGATLGMVLMTSAQHLLMVYIAVEMASLPSYGLAGFLKEKRESSEASLKYVVYGGAASGVMLYGISLLAGRFGTAYLPELANAFSAAVLARGTVDHLLLLATLLILIGMAFKLAAVPFHFWCPDVFEGASAEVAAFLSVASKGAALGLVGRFALSFMGGYPGASPLMWNLDHWRAMLPYLGPALALLAALTATFGNLAAYAQTNLKRLLAYSTIAHAGYMLMAVAPLTREGLEAMLFYLIVYVFMNMGAFAVVAFIRNHIGSEDLKDYSGLASRAPLLAIVMGIFLLSLVGVPPLFGFVAKYQVFAALYDGWATYQQPGLLALLVIGLLNTVLSLFYYVKVLKVMVLESPPEGQAGLLPVPLHQVWYASLLAAVVGFGMLAWNPLATGTQQGASSFPPLKASQKPIVLRP
ncbi:MAG: NADH-quinone oxidoreductase subunit N [Gemmataceae bacterium]